jgi:hypothetical protein
MNLAFYVNELNNNDMNVKIYECLNEAIEKDVVKDASLFINNVNFMDKPIKFGVFNATELWNYSGLLVVSDVSNAYFTNRVVNNFKPIFMFDGNKNNLLALIDMLNLLDSFVTTEEHQKEIFRITGKTLPVIELKAKNILERFVNE